MRSVNIFSYHPFVLGDFLSRIKLDYIVEPASLPPHIDGTLVSKLLIGVKENEQSNPYSFFRGTNYHVVEQYADKAAYCLSCKVRDYNAERPESEHIEVITTWVYMPLVRDYQEALICVLKSKREKP